VPTSSLARRRAAAAAIATTLLLAATACSDGATPPPDVASAISVAAPAAALAATQGQTGTGRLTITRRGGFAGAVTLAVADLPPGVAATLTPATLEGDATRASSPRPWRRTSHPAATRSRSWAAPWAWPRRA
jgi:hypothetical protein